MTQIDDIEVIELRREVMEFMGRCILNLQKYELGMKQLLAASEGRVSATKQPSTNVALRNKRYSNRTLGQLINEFIGNYVSPNSQGDPDEGLDNTDIGDCSSGGIEFQFQFSVQLSEEEHVSLCENLSELVNLRNELVHHFVSRHPLLDKPDCLAAKQYLIDSLDLIRDHIDQLKGFLLRHDSMRKQVAQVLSSDNFWHFIDYGFHPGEPINWLQTSVVGYLKAAESEFQNDGWTELLSAVDWMKAKAPHLSHKSYGCVSWQALLRASSLFEMRQEQLADRRIKTLYRSL